MTESIADRTILDADYAFGELDMVIVMDRVEDIEAVRGEYGLQGNTIAPI